MNNFSDLASALPLSSGDFTRSLAAGIGPPPNMASDFHERLTKWIRDFEAELDDQTEVAMRLVNFGQAITFHLTGIGYWNPALIRFDGVDGAGNVVQLIQHVTQISVLLVKEPKRGDKATRIGFISEDDTE